MSWRLAPSLQLLFKETDQAYPNHNHSRDGSIGDASHQAVQSGHNPDSRGVVHAIDIDINGIPDTMDIVQKIIADGKVRLRVWYVIHRGLIWSRTTNWSARRYNGSDQHFGHVHIELIDELNGRYNMGQIEAAENNLATWGIGEATHAKPKPKPMHDGKPSTYLLKHGDTLGAVAKTFGVSLADLVRVNGIENANDVPAGLRLAIPGRPRPNVSLAFAKAAIDKGQKAAPETWNLLDYWLPGKGPALKFRYSMAQQAQGYKGTRPGGDADGVPGVASLTKLASKHGWGVVVKR